MTWPAVHSLMPAFLFSGNGDTNYGLHRVYVFSDRDCVNVVFRGSITPGPAYAPRTTGPARSCRAATRSSPTRPGMFLSDGSEAPRIAADTDKVKTLRGDSSAAAGGGAAAGAPRTRTPRFWSRTERELGDPGRQDRPLGSQLQAERPLLLDGRPGPPGDHAEGRRVPRDRAAAGLLPGPGRDVDPACDRPADALVRQARRRAAAHARQGRSRPASRPTGSSSPASRGQVAFYGSPARGLDAAPSASAYVVEWSKTAYPWRPAGP